VGPKSCWERLREALADGDLAEAREAALDLDRWRLRSDGPCPEGVPPNVWRPAHLAALANVLFAAMRH